MPNSEHIQNENQIGVPNSQNREVSSDAVVSQDKRSNYKFDPKDSKSFFVESKPKMSPSIKKLVTVFVMLSLSFFIVGTGFIVIGFLQESGTFGTEYIQKDFIVSSRGWINCYSAEEIIVDEDLEYLGCDGGVLILDDQQSIVDKIDMSDGLSDPFAKSLLKDGNELYLGWQNGFTRFNLSSREFENVGIEQGLISEANIIFEDDGDYIWVGTFEGLSLYNKSSREVLNYTEVLSPDFTSYSVTNILATQNAVYVHTGVNSQNPGTLSRLDKSTQEWEYFYRDDFAGLSDGLYINSIVELEDKVLVKIGSDNYFEINDAAGETWTPVSLDSIDVSNELLALFDEETIDLTESVLQSINQPFKYDSILTVVDSKVFIRSENELWLYDLYSNEFEILEFESDLAREILSDDVLTIIPVEGTNKILLISQSCEQLCNEPSFYWLYYPEFTLEEIVFEDISYENEEQTFITYLGIQDVNGLKEILISADSQDFERTILRFSSEGVRANNEQLSTLDITTNCNEFRSAIFDNGEFKYFGACDPVIQDVNYEYKISADRYSLNRISKINGTEKEMNFPSTKGDYNPFGDPEPARIIRAQVFNGKLWLATTRGLAVYTPLTETWRLVSHQDGLTGNLIRDFVIKDNLLIVLTEGGFNVLEMSK